MRIGIFMPVFGDGAAGAGVAAALAGWLAGAGEYAPGLIDILAPICFLFKILTTGEDHGLSILYRPS
jgi:hypothetical protein